MKGCKVFEGVDVFYDESKKYDGDNDVFISACGAFERGEAFSSISVNRVGEDGKGEVMLSLGIVLQSGQYRRVISSPKIEFSRGKAGDKNRQEEMKYIVGEADKYEWLSRNWSDEEKKLCGYATGHIYLWEKIEDIENNLGDCSNLEEYIVADLRGALELLRDLGNDGYVDRFKNFPQETKK